MMKIYDSTPYKNGLYAIKFKEFINKFASSETHRIDLIQGNVFVINTWFYVIDQSHHLKSGDCYVVYVIWNKLLERYEIASYIYDITNHKFFKEFNTILKLKTRIEMFKCLQR